MEALFLKILNMSISAVWLILAVAVLRLVLKNAPKAVRVIMWGLVALRLMIPISLESVLSLIPSAETVPQDIGMAATPAINSGVPVIDQAVNPIINVSLAPPADNFTSINPMQVVIAVSALIWLAGVAVMAVYSVVSYAVLNYKVRASINVKDNIYVCDDISSPFILGIIKPRIYLPSALEEKQLSHVVAHEKAHLKRLDHLWKPAGFAVLAVHWFNPFVWAAYVLLCRDIEFACDEKVIKTMEAEDIRAYSETLLSCSVSRRMITACPVAFGEIGVKERIKTVLNYKKPAFWIIIAAVLVCIATAVMFLTNPSSDDKGEGADIGGSSGVTETGSVWFDAVILNRNGKSFLVKPCEGTNELRSSDKMSFTVPADDAASNAVIGSMKTGDKIRIYYDGMIQELYPAVLPNVERVMLTEKEPERIYYTVETAYMSYFPANAEVYTTAVNGSGLSEKQCPIHVFEDYESFESFIRKYNAFSNGDPNAGELLNEYDKDYFVDNSVILVYVVETYSHSYRVSNVTNSGGTLVIDFTPVVMLSDPPENGYRCRFHAVGTNKRNLEGVTAYYAEAEKPQPSATPSEPADNTVYDLEYYGYSTRAAFFVDFTSPLYKNSLNYGEVTDKTVYGCPIHKFSSYDDMKEMLEPYKNMPIGVMETGVKSILSEAKNVFNKYDTVFLAYVKSYNFDLSFYPSSLKKQGNRLSFGISSNGPEVISDVQSGWFVLFGVNSSDVGGVSSYSATVTDREFLVVPEVKSDIFKVETSLDPDHKVFTKADNAPVDVGSEEMPVHLVTSNGELTDIFGGIQRKSGEKDWTKKYNDGYFENKALFVCYFTAPSGSHEYKVSDSYGAILRTELTGAYLSVKAERSDPPNNEETDDEQGWILLLEVDKAHVQRNNLTVSAVVEYENTRRH